MYDDTLASWIIIFQEPDTKLDIVDLENYLGFVSALLILDFLVDKRYPLLIVLFEFWNEFIFVFLDLSSIFQGFLGNVLREGYEIHNEWHEIWVRCCHHTEHVLQLIGCFEELTKRIEEISRVTFDRPADVQKDKISEGDIDLLDSVVILLVRLVSGCLL